MEIGLVDVYANHGVLAIGANPVIADDFVLGDRPVALSPSHILLSTRGQSGLTRVRLWSGFALRTGLQVVDTQLDLTNGHLFVFDIESIALHQFSLSSTGSIAVKVMVDDPGRASRVDVIIGKTDGNAELTRVSGFPSFSAMVPLGEELAVADELALILAGHDQLVGRLAAALKLVTTAPALRPAVVDARVSRIAEWLRWVDARQTLAMSFEIGEIIKVNIERLRSSATDLDFINLAKTCLSRIG